MPEKYEKPEVEFVEMEEDDIVTASPICNPVGVVCYEC